MRHGQPQTRTLIRMIRFSFTAGLLLLLPVLPVQAGMTISYTHTDVQGNVIAVTDENQTVIERREYEPYGLPQTPINDDTGFTGHLHDGDTGLVYMQQRYYDPMTGRFLSADPVGVSTSNGANFNRYKYANNNPYRFVDPDGRLECDKGEECNAETESKESEKEGGGLKGYRSSAGYVVAAVQVADKSASGLNDVTTDNRYPAYETEKGTTIQLNGTRTDLPTGDTLEALIQFADDTKLDTVLVTGGSEAAGHSSGSFHGKNLAVDIAGPRFNKLSHDTVREVAKSAGFTHGVFEDFSGNTRDHWHLQIGAGNGLGPTQDLTNSQLYIKDYNK